MIKIYTQHGNSEKVKSGEAQDIKTASQIVYGLMEDFDGQDVKIIYVNGDKTAVYDCKTCTAEVK